MKLIVGLGNPGKKYEGTRHNIGFLVLDELKVRISNDPEKLCTGASQFLISKQFQSLRFRYQKRFESEVLQINDLLFVKPQTYMNRSGEAVKKLATSYNLSAQAGLQVTSLFVVHDDLDIPLGKFKIQFGKGPQQHNGLQSIYKKLGTKDFWHVRIGIEHRAKGPSAKLRTDKEHRARGEEYVLQRFIKDEREVIDQVVFEVVRELAKKFF